MRVQDLQLYLSNFTKGSDAVKNAVIYVEINGKLHAIRRMEVHENATPIIGQPGHSAPVSYTHLTLPTIYSV